SDLDDGIDAGGGNDVAREWLARAGIDDIDAFPRRWIGLAERRALWQEPSAGAVVGEIARKLRERWIGSRGRGANALPETFIMEEPDRAVLAVVDLGNENRSADSRAEIVLVERWFYAAGAIEEKIVGIHHAVLKEIENTAVKVVRSGAHGCVNYS